MGFLGNQNIDANQLSFVGQHLDKPSMRNTSEVLVVDSTNVDFLFPVLVLANNRISMYLAPNLVSRSLCSTTNDLETPGSETPTRGRSN